MRRILKRTTNISLRIPLDEIDDIEKQVKSAINPDGKFNSVSEAIRECAKLGHQILEYQEMMKDPEKKNEFVEKIQELIDNQNFEELAQTFTTEQLDGFSMFLRLEKDKRYKMSKLL